MTPAGTLRVPSALSVTPLLKVGAPTSLAAARPTPAEALPRLKARVVAVAEALESVTLNTSGVPSGTVLPAAPASPGSMAVTVGARSLSVMVAMPVSTLTAALTGSDRRTRRVSVPSNRASSVSATVMVVVVVPGVKVSTPLAGV